MIDKKLNAAVIGVGYLGNFHAQKYLNNSKVNLVGVCDHHPEQADKIASQLGVKSYHRPQDLIGKVDLVTIAASTLSHYEIAELFLKNGVHVNVEKPITATLPQAEALVKLAKEKNLKLAVGHIERFNPTILELRKHMERPRFIELNRMAPFKSRGADVSVLHDLMIHDLDLLLWLSGSDIESIRGSGVRVVSRELDAASVSIKMKNGILGFINVSRISPAPQRSIRVLQEGCSLIAHTGANQIEKTEKDIASAESAMSVTKIDVPKQDALQQETDLFVDAVLSNKTPAVTGEDGLLALRHIEAIEKLIGG